LGQNSLSDRIVLQTSAMRCHHLNRPSKAGGDWRGDALKFTTHD